MNEGTFSYDPLEATFSPGTVFRHYKSGIYELVCEAMAESDHTAIMVYHSADGQVRCRPKSVFFEQIEIDDRRVPRFSRCESKN